MLQAAPFAGDDRRVLPAPFLNAEVDDRQVGGAEDPERGGEAPLTVTVAGERAQNEIRDVNEDAEE